MGRNKSSDNIPKDGLSESQAEFRVSEHSDLSFDSSARRRFTEIVKLAGSLKAAANLLDVSVVTLARWRDGKRQIPLEAAAKLCKATNRSLDWLVFGAEPSVPVTLPQGEISSAGDTITKFVTDLDVDVFLHIRDGIIKTYREAGAELTREQLGWLLANWYVDSAFGGDKEGRKNFVDGMLRSLSYHLRQSVSDKD